MKFKLTLLILVILSVKGFAQSNNNISVQYASTSNTVNIHGAIGDFGYNDSKGKVFSLNYSRNINPVFSIESGLQYNNNTIQLTTIGPRGATYNGELNLITVPVIAKFTFFKYLFADCGILADFETNYASSEANSSATKQTGIGCELGFGAKYAFGHVQIFVNPFFQNHTIVPFGGASGSNFNLIDTGVKFGLGYNF